MRVHSSDIQNKVDEFLALPVLPYADSEKFKKVRDDIVENVVPELEEIRAENKEAMERTISNSDLFFYGDVLALQHNISILAENMRVLQQIYRRLSAMNKATGV